MQRLDQKLFEEKVGTKWFNYLYKFFESEEAWNIYQTLKNDGKTEVICPSSKDTWNFLRSIDPDNVKVITIALDPYPGRYNKNILHSTGISFDNSNSPDEKIQPLLKEFWNGLSNDFKEELPQVKDLNFLLEQGLFLGTRGLTCKLYKSESHIPLWDPFWKVFFEEYVSLRPNVPIVFIGKSAEKLKKYVGFNRTFSIAHPSSSLRSGETWATQGVFTKCNQIIDDCNGKEYIIDFNHLNYQAKKEIETCPF